MTISHKFLGLRAGRFASSVVSVDTPENGVPDVEMVIHWAVTQNHVEEPHPVLHKGKNDVCALSTDNHNILGYEQDNWQKIDVTDRSGDTGNFCWRLQ